MMASAKNRPKRAKFCSWPLRVAVIITRFVADNLLRKGALAEEVLIIARGRRNGCNQAANSVAETSGPRKLNLASLPSNVPWPMNTSQSGVGAVFGSAAMDCFSRSQSFVEAAPLLR